MSDIDNGIDNKLGCFVSLDENKAIVRKMIEAIDRSGTTIIMATVWDYKEKIIEIFVNTFIRGMEHIERLCQITSCPGG
jgi:hypothetical protein